MNEIDKVKEAANPFIQLSKKIDILIEQGVETAKQDIIKITLLGRLCTLKEDFQEAWFKSSNKKFKVSVVAIMVTGAVLYMDILKLNPDSEIVGSVIRLINALSGWL